MILEELLQPLVRVAADLADDVASLLGLLVDVPRKFLAALVGQRRNRNANDLAVVGRIEPEVRGADRFLDRAPSATDRTAAPRSAPAPAPTAIATWLIGILDP